VFDPAWLDEVPEFTPGPGLPGDVARLLERGYGVLQERGELELFPGYGWTVLAAQETEELSRLESSLPFVDRVAVGFLEPDIDGRSGFGVLAYVEPPEGPLDDDLHTLNSEDRVFVVAGQELPVAVRIVTTVLETGITVPSQAQAAVWTAVGRGTRPREGWLLPYHAVGSKNAGVTYSDGHQGRVVDSFGYCWDAVIASSDLPSPPSTAVAALDVLAPKMSLVVVAHDGTTVASTLMDVDVNIGLLSYTKAPLRMTYDWASSVPGDSGALVSDQQTSAPVAMHQGSSTMRDVKGDALTAPDGSQIKRAFGLCLFQIQAAKRGEFFV
jgi:hypothetical protein